MIGFVGRNLLWRCWAELETTAGSWTAIFSDASTYGKEKGKAIPVEAL
jgi:hypothetical protein